MTSSGRRDGAIVGTIDGTFAGTPGRPGRVVGLLLALVVLCGHVTVHSAAAKPPVSTPTSTLVVLGDSLTWGANYFAKTQSQLVASGTFESVVVDGWWSRRIGGIISTTYSGANTYKKLVKDGVRPTAVIVALGSNDVYFLKRRREYALVIRELMDAIGNIPVVWLNVHRVESTVTIARSALFNDTLVKVLAEYPAASVHDWVEVVRTTPGVMAYDKIHLSPFGYKVRSNTYVALAGTLAQRASDATSTTSTSTTTTSTTTTSTTTTVAPTTTGP